MTPYLLPHITKINKELVHLRHRPDLFHVTIIEHKGRCEIFIIFHYFKFYTISNSILIAKINVGSNVGYVCLKSKIDVR